MTAWCRRRHTRVCRIPKDIPSVPSAVSIEGNRGHGQSFVVQSSPYLLATLKRPDRQSPYSVFLDVAFSPDGGILAGGSLDGTVALWDVASRREIATLEGHRRRVDSVAFSPDGDMLASGGRDGTVKLWDVASRRQIAALEADTRYVRSVAFSPRRRHVGFGGEGRHGQVMGRGVAAANRRAHRAGWVVGDIRGLFFRKAASWRPQRLMARSSCGDVVSGELLETYWMADGYSSIAFSPDGGTMATTAEHEVELWNMSPYTNPETRSPDWDGDGEVGFEDFVKFAAKYGYRRGRAGYDPRYDLDRDGAVGFSDFLIFARAARPERVIWLSNCRILRQARGILRHTHPTCQAAHARHAPLPV